ncbi:helix-turn-helix transcriptional regulator [Nonomuraea typhae]|uniref:Helix-turn-helix transcriptional regulator n=1 Tax=Nonomuraea typhae TaxID=2603600 RepID=A0ABW7YW01_9ACTN
MTQDLPARLLRLLSLLQTRRAWQGAELAERLGVTLRTVRRDVDRLRHLGYPVQGTTGQAGGYRLAAGTELPPLLLDDEEAVAIAVALSTATGGITGIEDTAVRALAKLQQVLPARLRHQIAALHNVTAPVPESQGTRADPAPLAILAAACRDHELVTFTYRTRDHRTPGDQPHDAIRRRVEPHSLVTAAGRWYLVGFDTDRQDWRTFRVDRLTDPAPTGRHAAPRSLPAADAATYVAARIAAAPARYTMRVTVSAETIRANPWFLPDRVRRLDDHTYTVDLAADDPRHLAVQLLHLHPASTFQGTPELAAHLEELAQHLLDAAHALVPAEPR